MAIPDNTHCDQPPKAAKKLSFSLNSPSTVDISNAGQGVTEDSLVSSQCFNFLAPAQSPDEIGRLGDYRILRVIGVGGMGVVFVAEDVNLGRWVALKVLKPGTAGDTARERFLREGKAAAALDHDNVVTIFQVGEDRETPFLAMQLLQGESLHDRLERETTIPATEVMRIGRQIAEGLGAAHQRGLVHRDVKPANIWLEGETRRVKLLDFGLARLTHDPGNLTESGFIVGTPNFMSPEQADGEKTDERSDLFSLGCVLYKLCTGKSPFASTSMMKTLAALAAKKARPVHELNPNIPPALSDLIMQLIAKNPDERPKSAREVANRLQEMQSDGTAQLPLSRRRKRSHAVQSASKPRTTRFVVFAVALLVVGLFLWLLFGFIIPSETPDAGTDGPSIKNNVKPATLSHRGLPMLKLIEIGRRDLIRVKRIDSLSTPGADWGPCISSDDLTLYFHSDRKGGFGQDDIWCSTRKTLDDEWSEPVNLGLNVNSPFNDRSGFLAPDGRTMIFESDRSGGLGSFDMWKITRRSKHDKWSRPVNLGANVNSPWVDGVGKMPADQRMLLFHSLRPGGINSTDLWWCKRNSHSDDWAKPQALDAKVNSPFADNNPFISLDGLTMMFNSNRPGGQGSSDLWISKRQSIDGQWSKAINLGLPINSKSSEHYPELSHDGRTLYFSVFGRNSWDLFFAQGVPDTLTKKLVFDFTTFNDEGALHLSQQKKLEELSVVATNLTDVGLAHLSKLPKLRRLQFRSGQFSKDAVQRFQAARPNCRVLKLTPDQVAVKTFVGVADTIKVSMPNGGTKTVNSMDDLPSDFHLQFLGIPRYRKLPKTCMNSLRDLPELTDFYAFFNDITNDDVGNWRNLPKLEVVHLGGCLVSNSGVEHLCRFQTIRDVNLNYTNIGDDALVHLAKLLRLESIGLRKTKITDAGVAHLTGLKKLHQLDLYNCNVNDAVVKHLVQIGSLRTLYIGKNEISPDGINRLRAALPNCRIMWK